MIGQRIYGIDFMKFIAVLMITNSHFELLYKDVNVGLATMGAHGNALFFFVSGFLLMSGLEKRTMSIDNWYKKRLQRLWPAVLLWTLIGTILWQSDITWQKIFLLSDYWFLQTIAVYYLLFYFVGNFILKHSAKVGWGLFACASLVSVFAAFMLPKGHGSIYHTDWHYIYNFPIMLLGGMSYRSRERISMEKKWLDRILIVVSFVLYFIIQSYGKNTNDWRWYTQLLALLPLMSFCYYGYKVCSQNWCEKLMTHKMWRLPFTFIAALTLEIYIVQWSIITDRYNTLFPLNCLIVFGMICFAAYILRVFVNMFLAFVNDKQWNWIDILKIKELKM